MQYEIVLPSREVIEVQLCHSAKTFLSLVSDNFVKTEFNSGVIVVISLLFRFIFSYVVKLVRFTSKSLETTLITFVIGTMFSLNYVILYNFAP